MENLTNNKKYLTFILIGLLSIVIGTSLTFIMFDLSGHDNSIQTGQISFVYTEPSNEVILKDQLPITDELGINQDKYFEFSVMSNATTNENDKTGVNIFYEISLSEKEVDQIYNQLEKNQIKIYLTKVVGEEENIVLAPTLISELEKSSYGDSLKIYDTKNKHHNNNGAISTKYRLRFWIDNEVNASDWYRENKYEYRFVVNVNGHAPNLDIVNDNTLATKIKTMYTVENGTAVEENGYYYLKGIEKIDTFIDSSSQLLAMYGKFGNVYLYRKADNSYNQDLLEQDIRKYMIEVEGVTPEQYEQIAIPFGGYVNALLGTIAGVVDFASMSYVEGKTIEDIPTLDEIMVDKDMSVEVFEMFDVIFEELMPNNKNSFVKMYIDGENINKELLNKNLELGVTLMGESDMIFQINNNFGSLSNYCIAEVNNMIDHDNMSLIAGKTIEDIPTLESLFLNQQEKILLTNTYVKLNNMLWKVMGVNSDDTIKLMSVYDVDFDLNSDSGYLNGRVGNFLGLNKNSSVFLELLKNTTLEDLIIEKKYEYEENGIKKEVSSRVGMITYDEFKKSMIGIYTYLYDLYSTTYVGPGPSVSSLIKENNETFYKYKYFQGYNINNAQEFEESESTRVKILPVITIENIEVIGDGSRVNPYSIKDEKTISEENFANSFFSYIFNISNSLYDHLYENMGFKYDSEKSSIQGNYLAGLSINDKCYYKTIEGITKVIEYSGNCGDKFANIVSQPYTIDTYSFNETKLTINASNATSYKWQQKIGDEWIDLEDYSGRITGTKTNELTIIPTSYFDKTNSFRCIIKNEISKVTSTEIIVNMQLTDGEFVYEEIEDTNKFAIIDYIGDYTNSQHFTLKDDDGSYHLQLPSVINGDMITEVNSVNYSVWYKKVSSIEVSTGIRKIDATIFPSYVSDSIINQLILPEGLEYVSYDAFSGAANINELIIPSTMKIIPDFAFKNVKLTNLVLKEGIEEIRGQAFMNSNLKALEIPSTVKRIGGYAFQNSRLATLILHNGLESIGANAFQHSYLSNLELPNTVNFIGPYAFRWSPITELTLPDSLKTIGSYTFYSSQLTNLEIPASIKIIGEYAFNRSNLTQLILHEGLERIEFAAFTCADLTELKLPSTLTIVEGHAFDGSRFTNLKIYGKTSLSDFTTLGTDAITMADGYEPQFIAGRLE